MARPEDREDSINKPISGIFFAGFFNCLSEEKSLASHLESGNHTAVHVSQTTPNCEYFSPNCAYPSPACGCGVIRSKTPPEAKIGMISAPTPMPFSGIRPLELPKFVLDSSTARKSSTSPFKCGSAENCDWPIASAAVSSKVAGANHAAVSSNRRPVQIH